MSRLSLTLAVMLVLGLPLSSQSFAAQVSASRAVAGGLPYHIPSLHDQGTVQPAAGHRLLIVTMTLSDEPIDTEVRRFVLVTSDGLLEPIGAGADDRLIVPFDRIPLGQEVGEILPSDAMIVLSRSSSSSVTLEVGARGTIAFLFDVPVAASVRGLRLPDGRELIITP